MNSTLLEIKNLTAEYDSSSLRVLHQVSFDFVEGDVLTIFGETGSGKSSLLTLLTGLFQERGLQIVQGKIEERDNLVIGYVPQDTSLLDPYQTLGSMFQELLGERFNLKTQECLERGRELLSEVGFPIASHEMSSVVHEWSGGMRFKVQLALSLALRPDVLLLDEPFSNLDEDSQDQLLQVLCEKKYVKSLVIVSHDPYVFQHVSNRYLVFKDGYLVESGAPLDLLSSPYHPYTRALIESFQFKRHATLREKASGEVCPFSDRCHRYKKVCDTFPAITRFPTRDVACYFPLRDEGNPSE